MILVLFVFGATESAAGQTHAAHPDLSGTWKLNVAKSKIPKPASVRPETIHIDCAGSPVVMNVISDTTGERQTFVADGESHVIAETAGAVLGSGGESLIHLAHWEKRSLITETIELDVTDARAAAPMSTVRERWTLAKGGVRLTREIDSLMEVLVYDKTD